MESPPLLISFSSLEQYLGALPQDVCTTYGDQIHSLASKHFPPVVSIRCLATLLGYSPKFVGALYRRTENYYRTFYIPKGKSRRIIHAPRVALKVIQKWFGHHLAEVISFDEAVFGFVRGRSAIQGAAIHCGADWIYSIDIKDFFPSTPEKKVVESLIGIGYPARGAELMGKLSSYNGFLSQGSPASPILSNLVFRSVDEKISALAARHGVKYTRYADDIVISGKNIFPKELKKEVKSIVEIEGWEVSAKKENYAERPNRLKVYGLLVHGEHPRLTKGYRNRIRAFRHLLKVEKVAEKDLKRIKGHLAYAQSVEDIDS